VRSGALLEQGQDGLVPVDGVVSSFFPNGVEGTILDPADLDGSSLAGGGVDVDVNFLGEVIDDEVFELSRGPTISSRTAEFDI